MLETNLQFQITFFSDLTWKSCVVLAKKMSSISTDKKVQAVLAKFIQHTCVPFNRFENKFAQYQNYLVDEIFQNQSKWSFSRLSHNLRLLMDRSETLDIFYKQIRVNGKDFFRVEGLALLKIVYKPNLFTIVPLYNFIIYNTVESV